MEGSKCVEEPHGMWGHSGLVEMTDLGQVPAQVPLPAPDPDGGRGRPRTATHLARVQAHAAHRTQTGGARAGGMGVAQGRVDGVAARVTDGHRAF